MLDGKSKGDRKDERRMEAHEPFCMEGLIGKIAFT